MERCIPNRYWRGARRLIRSRTLAVSTGAQLFEQCVFQNGGRTEVSVSPIPGLLWTGAGDYVCVCHRLAADSQKNAADSGLRQ